MRLGLRANLGQFLLLVAVNALVGGTLGQERTVVPLLAARTFHLQALTGALTFILAFGAVKAITNYFAGTLSDRFGRKPVLVAGWLAALPAPALLIWAPNWGWVIAANAFLGVNQGLTWSTTVIMKIDLAGSARRGLAMGLNEAAGYGAVAVTALATGYLASAYGLRPAPFLLGAAYIALGLGLSAAKVRETRDHARQEAASRDAVSGQPAEQLTTGQIARLTSFRERALSAASWAGMVNNLNDGLAWGAFPVLFARHGLNVAQIGVLVALYPAVWGAGQLGTGALSDRIGRKWLIAVGMLVQALAIGLVALGTTFTTWAAAAVLLGAGTAMVYPTLLAVIGDVAHPAWRARSVGVYRLWRDAGFVVGALLAGGIADAFGLLDAIWAVAALTAAAGVLVAARMYETRSGTPPGTPTPALRPAAGGRAACGVLADRTHYDTGTIDRARRRNLPGRGRSSYRYGVLSGHGVHIGWRWLVVVAGVVVLCCLPALAGALPVSGSGLTAAQLESRILGSQRLTFSGYAESDANFGLPALPAFSSVTPLLDGVSRMRVWQAAPDRWRVDTLSDTGENDTYQDGDSTFIWDSGEQLLTGIYGVQTVRLPRAADLQPEALAVLIIREAGAGAEARTLPPQRVAGQDAAGLEITPAAPQSTIARADIWASPASGLPLRVEVFDRGKAQPALESQFLQVGAWTPDAGVLTPRYSPGTGFTTTTPADLSGVLKDLDDERLPVSLAGLARQPSPVPQVGVYGDGLAVFAVLTFHHDTGSQLLQNALDAGAAPLSGPDVRAGAVAGAPLVNLVLVRPAHSPDVFLLVGLVSKATLEQAAGELATRPDRDLFR